MIITRAECRMLAKHLTLNSAMDDATADLVNRIKDEARQADVLPPGTARGSDGVIRIVDPFAREARVHMSTRPVGRRDQRALRDFFAAEKQDDFCINGTVIVASQDRCYVLWDETQTQTWVPKSMLRAGEHK